MKKFPKKTDRTIKAITSTLRKNKYEIVLAILVIVAAFLRSYKQVEYIDFFGDVGRDMIIAKHVAEDMKWTEAKPYAASVPYLNNSMFYFNFLGFIWFLFPSILSANMFHAIISLSVIILGYLIGKELADKNMGIIVATYFTFSFYFISIARFIWQPNLIPYFFMAGLYFFIKSFKKPKLKYLYLSILFLFFCLNMHYSTLLVVPIISVWLIKRHSEIIKNEKREKVINWLLFSTYIYSLFIIWTQLVDLKIKNITQILLNSQNSYSIEKFITHGIETIVLFSKFLYGNHDYSPFLYLIFIIAIIFSLINKKIKMSKPIIFIYSLNFSIVAAFFLKKNIYTHYYGPLFIVAYVSSAILVDRLIRIKLLKMLVITFLFTLFLHSTADDNKLIGLTTYFGKWERNDYQNAKEISEAIIKDYQNKNDVSFDVRMRGYENFQTSKVARYYIFLEQITEKRLTTIKNEYNSSYVNIQIIEKNPDVIYIVCFRFPQNMNLNKECLKPLFDNMTDIDESQINIKKIKEIKQYSQYTSLYLITKTSNK